MPLNNHHIEELKNLYRQEMGEDLSDREAWDMSQRLISLHRLVIRKRVTDPSPDESRDPRGSP